MMMMMMMMMMSAIAGFIVTQTMQLQIIEVLR